MKKAAVVIGVNRPASEFTPLQSAVASANEVAAWLKNEGYDVACLTDGPKRAVASADITKAIERFVTVPIQYQLLVVYFSGHGCVRGRSDYWLLSRAPTSSSEAINLNAAMEMAKYSGIKNVVFISDACRSLPNTPAQERMYGVAAFPSYNEIKTPSKVDSFLATAFARPAYEINVGKKAYSALSLVLRSAYQSPRPELDMVRTVEVDDQLVEVVPNRQLEDFLQAGMKALLKAEDPKLDQPIEICVPSDDKVFIARVVRQEPSDLQQVLAQLAKTKKGVVPLPPPPSLPPTKYKGAPNTDAFNPPTNFRLPVNFHQRVSLDTSASPTEHEDARAISKIISDTLRERKLGARGPRSGFMKPLSISVEDRLRLRIANADAAFSQDTWCTSGTGAVVDGAVIAQALVRAAAPGMAAAKAQVVQPGGKAGSGWVHVHDGADGPLPDRWAGSLALRFADGRCALLPVLPGYVAHVRVAPEGIAGMSFQPSPASARWPDYADRRDELDRLRAMMALATEHNTLRFETDREAGALVKNYCTGKVVDPALNLYAGLAFSRAGQAAYVAKVRRHIVDNLGLDLFDLWLLASRAPKPGGVPCVPPCPLFSRNWSLLDACGAVPPEPLWAASAHLCHSLWTTFTPDGGEIVMAWISQGENP